MTDILTTAGRALVNAQAECECFDALEPEAQEAAIEHVRAVLRAFAARQQSLGFEFDAAIFDDVEGLYEE